MDLTNVISGQFYPKFIYGMAQLRWMSSKVQIHFEFEFKFKLNLNRKRKRKKKKEKGKKERA